MAEALLNLLAAEIFLPYAVEYNGTITQIFDALYHKRSTGDEFAEDAISRNRMYDGRWAKCQRPFISSGGELGGNGHVEAIEIVNNNTGQQQTIETPAVFSFIGATPRTDWLPPEVERDAKGFVLTGATVAHSQHWGVARTPFLLETSHPGVFVAGDVRGGAAERAA